MRLTGIEKMCRKTTCHIQLGFILFIPVIINSYILTRENTFPQSLFCHPWRMIITSSTIYPTFYIILFTICYNMIIWQTRTRDRKTTKKKYNPLDNAFFSQIPPRCFHTRPWRIPKISVTWKQSLPCHSVVQGISNSQRKGLDWNGEIRDLWAE